MACSTAGSPSREFVADDYSIADIAIWPWISRFEWQTIDLDEFPQRQALVPDDRQAPGGAARLSRAQSGERDTDAGMMRRLSDLWNGRVPLARVFWDWAVI